MSLLDDLRELKANGPVWKECGICMHICTSEDRLDFTQLATKWPRFSGMAEYPVPPAGEPDEDMDAEYAYDSAGHMIMWADWHPYGQARLELLDWCIDQLEAQA